MTRHNINGSVGFMSDPAYERLITIDAEVEKTVDTNYPNNIALKGIERVSMQAERRIAAEAVRRQWVNQDREGPAQRRTREQECVRDLILEDAAHFASYLVSKGLEPKEKLMLPNPIKTYSTRTGLLGRQVKTVESNITHLESWLLTGYEQKVLSRHDGWKDTIETHRTIYVQGLALGANGKLYHYTDSGREADDSTWFRDGYGGHKYGSAYQLPKNYQKPLYIIGKELTAEELIPVDSIDVNDVEQVVQNKALTEWHGKFVDMAARELAAG